MIDEHDVAARDAHLFDPLAFRGRAAHREAERKGQRVFLRPLDLDDRFFAKRILPRHDAREHHRVPVRGIGVGGEAGGRAEDFLEDEDVTHPQMQRRRAFRVDEGRTRRAARQAALLVFPSVKLHLAVPGENAEPALLPDCPCKTLLKIRAVLRPRIGV